MCRMIFFRKLMIAVRFLQLVGLLHILGESGHQKSLEMLLDFEHMSLIQSLVWCSQ